MAMSSHGEVVENEIIPIGVTILGTAPSTNVKIDTCVSCDKHFGPASMSQAKSCFSCQKFCHPSCMEDDKLCLLCQKQEQILTQRQGAKRKQQDQADKILERSVETVKQKDTNASRKIQNVTAGVITRDLVVIKNRDHSIITSVIFVWPF